jgi:hypothetical protein
VSAQPESNLGRTANSLIDGTVIPMHPSDACRTSQINRVTLVNSSTRDEGRFSMALPELLIGQALTAEEYPVWVERQCGAAPAPKVLCECSLDRFGADSLIKRVLWPKLRAFRPGSPTATAAASLPRCLKADAEPCPGLRRAPLAIWPAAVTRVSVTPIMAASRRGPPRDRVLGRRVQDGAAGGADPHKTCTRHIGPALEEAQRRR